MNNQSSTGARRTGDPIKLFHAIFRPTRNINHVKGGEESGEPFSTEQNLDASLLPSPERSGHTVRPGDIRRLEQGCSPGPLRHDHRGGKTGLDAPTSRVELSVTKGINEDARVSQRATSRDQSARRSATQRLPSSRQRLSAQTRVNTRS